MIILTGATGNTGSVVADALLAAGQKVRILARNPEKARALAERGAEIVPGDIADRAALERAFSGAQALYLLSPPDAKAEDFIAERRVLMERLVSVAREAQLGHVVFLSSIGAQHPDGTGLIRTAHDTETLLRAAGIPSTFLRAGYFAENWAAVVPVARTEGVLPSFLPLDQSVPMVATRDIGRLAAQVLLEGPRGTRVLELAGPIDVTPRDVALALGEVLAKKIHTVEAPLESVVPTFTSFGVSAGIAALYREMYAGFRSGRVAWQGAGSEFRRGTTSITDVLRALAR